MRTDGLWLEYQMVTDNREGEIRGSVYNSFFSINLFIFRCVMTILDTMSCSYFHINRFSVFNLCFLFENLLTLFANV